MDYKQIQADVESVNTTICDFLEKYETELFDAEKADKQIKLPYNLAAEFYNLYDCCKDFSKSYIKMNYVFNAGGREDGEITESIPMYELVNDLSENLNALVDDASNLYLSEAEIPKELAIELGYLYDMCRDYVQMYENCSRDYPVED